MTARTIFRLSGADTRPFLQNLVTINVDQIDQGLVYAALLTPQGKYLADFFLLSDGAEVLLDVDANLAQGLAQRLNMYRLRAQVTVSETELQVKRGTGDAPEGAMQDPRHPALGWRLYGAEGGDDGSDWDAIRVTHCIPETGIELTGDSYILEAGFEALSGVDFRKGCYVGQEVTARMKHKTTLKKGLQVVEVSGNAPVGTEITAAGKAVGTLYTQAGGKGIAYLRYDRATGEMEAGDATLRWTPPVEPSS